VHGEQLLVVVVEREVVEEATGDVLLLAGPSQLDGLEDTRPAERPRT